MPWIGSRSNLKMDHPRCPNFKFHNTSSQLGMELLIK
uniref:Uncharacterized protein n=1 Tax=Rhizophora mucronata TaxID=61149 RepID=A0A2P2QNV6_RHIMU